MSATWFTIKSLAFTFLIISILQIRVGSDAQTLEYYFTSWMKHLSASKRIQKVAEGGKVLTGDIIREFTTSDGRKIFIQERAEDKTNKKRSVAEKLDATETKVIQKLVNGLKLDFSDLGEDNKNAIKEQARQELENEIRKEYENKLKRSGIDPKVLKASR